MKHVIESANDFVSVEDNTMDTEKDQNSNDTPTPSPTPKIKVDKKDF